MDELRTGGQGEYQLQGRIAVVTGGSNGIGAATARRLAMGGAKLIIGYNNGRERAEALISELPGTDHLAIRIAIESSETINAAVEAIQSRFGRADILVNCAGITVAVPHANLNELDDQTFDRILVTNVRGTFAAIRAFTPLLKASGDGAIINISSLSATTGLGSSIAYCASKAALDTMALSLARVLAPEIRIIGVSPAAVATDFVPGRGREGVERQAASTPLRTVAEPDDVALAVIAAITQLRLTTGSNIVVDGGRHL